MTSLLHRIGREYERAWKVSPMLTLAVVNGALAIFGDATAQVLPIILSSGGATAAGFDLARSFRYWLFGTVMGPIGGQWNHFLEHRFPLHAAPQPTTSSAETEKRLLSLSEKTPGSPSPAPAKSHVIGMSGPPSTPSKAFPKSGRSTPLYGSPRVGGAGAGAGKGTGPPGLEAAAAGEKSRPSILAVLKRLASDQLFMAPLSLLVFFSYMAFMEGLSYSAFSERLERLYFKLLQANWQVWPLVQLFNFRYMPLRYRVPFGAACGVLWTVFLSFATRPVVIVPVVAAPAPTKAA